MIVLTRFEVGTREVEDFLQRAEAAVALLGTRPGFVSADVGRNLDAPALWTIVTRWQNVGSYRRALSGNEAKMIGVPLLSLAIDEPTAYDDPDLVGENVARTPEAPG